MESIQTDIDVNGPEFIRNRDFHRALAGELRQRLEAFRMGGGEKYR